MVRPKQVPKEERQTIDIYYVEIPYIAVTSTDPKLSGHYGVGATRESALSSFRSSVRRVYPHNKYDIIEHGAGIE